MKKILPVFNLVLAMLLIPAAYAYAEKTPKVSTVTCDELRQTMQTSTNTIIVDVRSIAEYQTAHIDGAVSKPLDTIATASWPKTADIVLYCSGKG